MSIIITIIIVLMLAELLGLLFLFVAYMISRIKENINHRRIKQWTLHSG